MKPEDYYDMFSEEIDKSLEILREILYKSKRNKDQHLIDRISEIIPMLDSLSQDLIDNNLK